MSKVPHDSYRFKQVLETCQCYVCRTGRGDEEAPQWVHQFMKSYLRKVARHEREAERLEKYRKAPKKEKYLHQFSVRQRIRDYVPFNQSSVYYDDILRRETKAMEKHNRTPHGASGPRKDFMLLWSWSMTTPEHW